MLRHNPITVFISQVMKGIFTVSSRPIGEFLHTLTDFSQSQLILEILICRLGALLGCTSLLSLARDSLVQTLLQRRSEFRLLLRFFYEPRLILPVVGRGTPQEKIVKNMSSYFRPF